MLNIENRIFIDIQIDGKPLDGVNLVRTIALLEGTPVIAPSMVMVLNDNSHRLTQELCLTDGNEILVTVGSSPQDLNTISRQYRVFSVQQLASTSGPCVKVLGIYDAPKYTTEAARESYSGTASHVIKQIAEKCGLDYDGPEDFNGRKTNDNQVWLAVAKTRGSFVQHVIAKHAYMDEYSAMYAALTSLGVLKFRNLMDVAATPAEEIKYVFAHNISDSDDDDGKTTYQVSQAKERSQAGLLNAMHNYGSSQITSGPTGVTQVEEKVDVKTSAPYLAINDQVAQTIGRTRISYTDLDCGNVHDKYYRASYQNVKQLALFSERESVLVTVPTDVQLFEPVIYKQADADPNRPVRNSDIYVVVGKTIFTTAGRHCTYGERIELVRMSITDKGEAELKSSEPAIARVSSIPEATINPSAAIASSVLPKTNWILAVMGPIEEKIRSATQSAQQALNNVKLTIPSFTVFGMNAGGYERNPMQAARDMRSAANSARQMRDAARGLKNSVSNAAQAIREGNVLLATQSLSNVARSAALFRPNGVASNVCSLFGVTQMMRTTAESYATIGGYLKSIKDPLNSALNVGQEVDSLVGDMFDVVNSYQSVAGSMASSYNSLIEAVTGDSPRFNIPNIDQNRYYFEDRIRGAIRPVTAPINEVSYTIPTVMDIQRNLATTLVDRDDTRNYYWAPESGYVASPVALDQLANKINELSEHIDAADRQTSEFLAGGG